MLVGRGCGEWQNIFPARDSGLKPCTGEGSCFCDLLGRVRVWGFFFFLSRILNYKGKRLLLLLAKAAEEGKCTDRQQ